MAEDKKDSVNYKDLPEVTETKGINKKDAAIIKELLSEYDSIQEIVELNQFLLDEIKMELQDYQGSHPGLRSGPLVFVARETAGRKTLSTTALMMNGVTKATLDASYKVGKPYVTRTFKNLDRKPEKKRVEGDEGE